MPRKAASGETPWSAIKRAKSTPRLAVVETRDVDVAVIGQAEAHLVAAILGGPGQRGERLDVAAGPGRQQLEAHLCIIPPRLRRS
jgi:hypothetical protein